ncbi:GNAT family N-acetyltransferase [Kutzneria chonburiensis]|uniref:GNAT family N-acetyltransferase n=1 Tax=Kutzneria chonburiensis TaxID=1483604 RepID=A0ABV6N3V2_9PSEU|nr:GNAT family N-acetyltransferase [Kutzneria chonburiensis]
MELLVRTADSGDVEAICQFGETYIPPHYASLIGAEAAEAQVRSWWNKAHIEAAVAAGLMVVAVDNHQVIGVGQRAENVIYKLYTHPAHRSRGLGPRLLAALVGQLPAGTDRVCIEHFAANERAGAFYEREGFPVERIEPSPTGNPALAIVWRARSLTD